MSAISAVDGPTPPINGNGMRNPNSARLGMVCDDAGEPDERRRRCAAARAARMPSGTPIGNRHQRRGDDEQDVLTERGQNLPRRATTEVDEGRHAGASVSKQLLHGRLVRDAHVGAAAERHQTAAIEHANARRHQQGLVQIVRHEQHGLPDFGLNARELGAELRARVTGSRAPNGSSISTIGGSVTSARAKPTR